MKAFVLGAAILWGTAGTSAGGLALLAIGLVVIALPARSRVSSRRRTRQAVLGEAPVRQQLDEILV